MVAACLPVERRLPSAGGRGCALADSERVLGADNPGTLTARINLGGAYQAAGRLGKAIPLFERTLTDADRVWAPTTQAR